jgi:general stress protein 26
MTRALATLDEKLEKLYELVEDIEVAILTTRRRDGSLVSRPMATQRRAEGAHFWFVTSREMAKLVEIDFDPNVNLSYFRPRTREWVSISGVAHVSTDESKIRELYEPSWKRWFPGGGGRKSGGPEDPRIVLVGVEARSAHYTSVERSAPVVLFEGLQAEAANDFGEVVTVPPHEWPR